MIRGVVGGRPRATLDRVPGTGGLALAAQRTPRDRAPGQREDREPEPQDEAPAPPRQARDDRLSPEIPLDLVRERARRAVTLPRVLLEAVEADRGEVAPGARVELPRGDGRLRQDLGDDAHARRALEGGLSAEHVIEEAAELVDVGALVPVRAVRLLGRHVGGRPDRLAAPGHDRAVVELREPEVDDVGVAVRSDEDVVGLEVPVKDALLVRVLDRARHVAHDLEALEEAGAVLLERAALDELHGEVEPSLRGARVVDGGDVRVAELREGLALAREAARERVGIRTRRLERLERDLPPQRLVPRAVDDAHAAASQLAEEDVAAEPLPRVRAGRRELVRLAEGADRDARARADARGLDESAAGRARSARSRGLSRDGDRPAAARTDERDAHSRWVIMERASAGGNLGG